MVLSADLGPECQLHGRDGKARRPNADLAATAATRARPEGNALETILERFSHRVLDEARVTGQTTADVADRHLETLEQQAGGYALRAVLDVYFNACAEGDNDRRHAAVRWIRGEFKTSTDARNVLGVRTIIHDRTVQEQLRVLAAFVRAAGYAGMLVTIDEMGTLTHVRSSVTRNQNYDSILAMLNQVHQGTMDGAGFLLAGTEEFVTDRRRGLFSREALATRLAENRFAENGLVDYEHPILRVPNLTREEMFVLLTKIRTVADLTDDVPDEALRTFMAHCSKHIGDAYFRTPRATTTAFANFLATLEQNPGTSWQALLRTTRIEPDDEGSPYGPPDGGGPPGDGRFGLADDR